MAAAKTIVYPYSVELTFNEHDHEQVNRLMGWLETSGIELPQWIFSIKKIPSTRRHSFIDEDRILVISFAKESDAVMLELASRENPDFLS